MPAAHSASISTNDFASSDRLIAFNGSNGVIFELDRFTAQGSNYARGPFGLTSDTDHFALDRHPVTGLFYVVVPAGSNGTWPILATVDPNDGSYTPVCRIGEFELPGGVPSIAIGPAPDYKVYVIAGGPAEPDATEIYMEAAVGSETYGILSNPFLDEAFKTVRYELLVKIHDDGSFSYEEDTVMKVKDQADLFHHRDSNRLTRT